MLTLIRINRGLSILIITLLVSVLSVILGYWSEIEVLDGQSGSRQTLSYSSIRAVQTIANFDSDIAGLVPSGWTSISGSWSVVTDGSSPSQPHSYAQLRRTAGMNHLTASLYSYDFTKQVHVLWEMKTSNTAGSGWASFGLTFLYQDSNNYYLIRRDDNGGDNNYIHVIKIVNGKETDLVRIPVGGTTSGAWRGYQITVFTNGSQATIQYNLDSHVGTVTDSTTWTTGRIGLMTSSQAPSTADATFDNIFIFY